MTETTIKMDFKSGYFKCIKCGKDIFYHTPNDNDWNFGEHCCGIHYKTRIDLIAYENEENDE